MSATPGVHTQLLSALVTALPVDHPEAYTWGLKVEWRGPGDWYAVVRGRHCLSVTGEWDPEPQPSSCDDAFLATHRFSHQAAMGLAAQAAPHVRINGVTAAQFAARIAEGLAQAATLPAAETLIARLWEAINGWAKTLPRGQHQSIDGVRTSARAHDSIVGAVRDIQVALGSPHHQADAAMSDAPAAAATTDTDIAQLANWAREGIRAAQLEAERDEARANVLRAKAQRMDWQLILDRLDDIRADMRQFLPAAEGGRDPDPEWTTAWDRLDDALTNWAAVPDADTASELRAALDDFRVMEGRLAADAADGHVCRPFAIEASDAPAAAATAGGEA